MFKWEDENWQTVTLSAGYAVNDRVRAQPYVIVPADEGQFSVYIEAEGFYNVKSIGGATPGSWCGFIAYNTKDPGWLVNQYSGCTITNYKDRSDFVEGHPDAVVNDCHLRAGRAVEADFYCSFDLRVEAGGGMWIIYAPYLQKDSDYNYIVSYGGYTNKTCEFGSLSISIDEVNPGSSSRARRPLAGVTCSPKQTHSSNRGGP